MNIYKIFVTGIIFVILDFVYLNLIKNYFTKQIYSVQKSNLQINFIGVILCYFFLILGFNYFIINKNKSIFEAFLLGILIYGVYETTNYSLLKNWNFLTVIIDTLWGGILFASTSYFYKKIYKKIYKKNL